MSLRLSLWLGVPLLLVGLRAWWARETQLNTWVSLGAGGFFLAYWFFFERESDPSEERPQQGASGAEPSSISIKKGSLSTLRSRRSRPRSQPRAAQGTSVPASGAPSLSFCSDWIQRLRDLGGLDVETTREEERALDAAGLDQAALLHHLCGNNEEGRSRIVGFQWMDLEGVVTADDLKAALASLFALAPPLEAFAGALETEVDLDQGWARVTVPEGLEPRQVRLPQVDDWFHPDWLRWVGHWLGQRDATRCWVEVPTDGQEVIVGCVTRAQWNSLRRLGWGFRLVDGGDCG